MGIEDGAALGIVLANVTNRSQIEERLAMYENLRRNRASAIQILSNVGLDQSHLVKNDLLEFLDEEAIPSKSKFQRGSLMRFS